MEYAGGNVSFLLALSRLVLNGDIFFVRIEVAGHCFMMLDRKCQLL